METRDCSSDVCSSDLTPLLDRVFGKKLIENDEQIEPIVEVAPEQGYTEYKNAAQQRLATKQQQTLDGVLSYTMKTLSMYMKESDIHLLCEHLHTFQFADERTCNAIDTFVVVDEKIRPIDLMHFGWNIGNQFKKSGIETATFLKRVFTKSLNDYAIHTLKSKLRMEIGRAHV